MYEDYETIQLNSTQRLIVEQDTCSDSPLEWGWEVELHEIDNYRMWRGWDTPDDAFAAFVHEVYYKFGRNKEVAERAARIMLDIMGDDRVPHIHEYQGYSQSDWATYLELVTPGDGSMFSVYAAWRRGDVYNVILQECEPPAIVDVRIAADGTFYTDEDEPDWIETESIGGCYLDDEYTAEDAARDYFNIKEGK